MNPAHRKILVFGGFPHDTDRTDIEEALRKILRTYEGVERISSMGKYGSCGKVYFRGKNDMGEFIKDSKGMKFDHEGVQRALWFFIEKTVEERGLSAKVGTMVKEFVGFLATTAWTWKKRN